VIYGRTRSEVAEKLNQALSARSNGLTLDAGRLTVGEYLDRWLEDCVKPLVDAGKMAHSSYVCYAGLVRNHITPSLGHRKLKNLSRAEIRKLYNDKGNTLSPRSVDYLHVTLQKALSQAVRDELIPRNVATGERPRSSRQRQEIKALSPTQVRALLSGASGERNEALYEGRSIQASVRASY